MPFLNQGLTVFIGRCRRITDKVRSVAIHHHLARNHAEVTAIGSFKKSIHRLGEYSRKDQSRGGAIPQQLIQKDIRDFAGIVLILKLGFGGKGVLIQPFQQLLTIGGNHPRLGIVDVGINKPRHDQPFWVGGGG